MTLTWPQSLPVPSPLPSVCQTHASASTTLLLTVIVCTNAFSPHQQTATYPNQNLLPPPPPLLPNPSSPPFLSSLLSC